MKKLLLILALAFSPLSVLACSGSYTLGVSSSANTTTVGNTVTFTVNVNASTRFSVWDASFSYDQSKLTYLSGPTNLSIQTESSPIRAKTFKYTFRTKATGTANFTFKVNELGGYDSGDFICPGSKSASSSLTINAPREASANNYLSNLVVENHQLSPAFNKNTLVYNLSLPEETKSININANKEDGRSSVTGLGNIALSEGVNTIKIVVTAENGRTRVYTINAHVKEKEPILVEIANKKYTVVRKAEEIVDLKPPSFDEAKTKINDEEVPAFINEKLNLTLVALRSEEGQIILFSYKDDKYSEFKSLNSKELYLIINEEKAVANYKKANLIIDSKNYQVYSDGNYYYFYATNVSSNKENLYRYEKTEKTIQIEKVKTEKKKKTKNIYIPLSIGLASLLVITYLFIGIKALKSKKTDLKNDDITDTIVSDSKKERRSKKK